MMTEDEANTKGCPIVDFSQNCLASQCACWVWDDDGVRISEDTKTGDLSWAAVQGEKIGHCGLIR